MDSLTRTLFDLTPAGAMLLRPLYDEHQHLVDFAYEQLNLAGQHMLRLPAQPAQTFLQLFPMALNTGVFAFYREAFLTGRPDFLGVDYRHDGLDAYYQLAAQRAGEYLVVSFTDTADRRQGDMVTALQRSHQAERVALAEAGRQGQHLVRLLEQVPAAMAVVVGPDFVYERFNPPLRRHFFRPAAGGPPHARGRARGDGPPGLPLAARRLPPGDYFPAAGSAGPTDPPR